MITHLRIQNVALIDEVEVGFAPGLNVLTGETGAGKSIVVDSINFLLGGRAVRDFIRTGADFAHVEGVLEVSDPFVKQALFALGLELPEGQLMLERTMQAATGKSLCRINGRTVAVGLLKDAASLLVDLHGQHEHQSLLDPVKQLRLLDQICDNEALAPKYELTPMPPPARAMIAENKARLETLLANYRETNKALKALAGVGNQRQEQVELWRHQLEEIEMAALKPGEEEELATRRNRLSGLEKLSVNTAAALVLLAGSPDGGGPASAADQTARALTLAAEMAKIDKTQEHLHDRLAEALAQLTDIVQELRDYIDELDADPQELERIEARLDVIYRLKKKYGQSVDGVLKKRDELQQSLESLENSEAEIGRLKAARREVIKSIQAVCDEMNTLRVAAAERVSASVSEILRDLGMQNARFFIDISRKTAFGPDGNDQVEYLISPNPGEPDKPLRRIASGGEMSRVMLAIKTVMADADRVSTVIFDEVDSGVSGRTAQQVAEKLMAVSRRRQILCITHLPQIAAMADTHFLIEKATAGGRTTTAVRALPNGQIINELARLIGGAQITEATLEAAGEMKNQANELKGSKA